MALPDTTVLTPLDRLADEVEPAYLDEVRGVLERARAYLARQPGVDRVGRGWLYREWAGGKVVVAYFEIPERHGRAPEGEWVVAGDLLSATIDAESNLTGGFALAGYVWEMERWVAAVRAGRDVSKLIPVNTPPTSEWADLLARRLAFIRRECFPECEDLEGHGEFTPLQDS